MLLAPTAGTARVAGYDVVTERALVRRHIGLVFQSLSPATRARLDPGITWFGWPVPPLVCALVVLALGAATTLVAIAEFEQRDRFGRSPAH